MTGPFTLIRKKSQKLKRRMSKHDKHSNDNSSNITNDSNINYNTNRNSISNFSFINSTNNSILSELDDDKLNPLHHHSSLRSSNYFDDLYSPSRTPKIKNSVSFDLSPTDRNEILLNNSPIYSSRSRSAQNLPTSNIINFKDKENLAPFYKIKNNITRRSIDNLGTLIKIPKRSNSPNLNLDSNHSNSNPNSTSHLNLSTKSNRKSFDIGSFQLSKSKSHSSKRVLSDSSIQTNSKSRPQSMILDHDSTFIPPYNIHNSANNKFNNISNNNITNTKINHNSNINNQNNNNNNNDINNTNNINNTNVLTNSLYSNRLSQSALSLNAIIDSSVLTLDCDVNDSKNQKIVKFDPKKNQKIFISNNSNLQRSQSANYGTHHNHKHKHNNHSLHVSNHSHHTHHSHSHHKSNFKTVNDNQGVISCDIETWSFETPLNILFAIIFHTLNIIFSICIYLPIYLIARLGFLSYLLFGFAFFTWYFYYNGNSNIDSAKLVASTTSSVISDLQQNI